MSRKKLTWLLILIIALATLAAFFIYPKDLGNKFRPWRLGLDLVGGTRLIYEIDMSQAKEADKSIVLGGLRDVIEKRVNLFGVSEPVIRTAKSGDTYRLIVELAGVKDVKKAIEEVGSTPLLEFREVIVP